MIIYTAEGDQLGVYQSKDGVNWSKAVSSTKSKINSNQFFRGYDFESPVECPAMRSMKTPNGKIRQVLFMGSKSPKDGQTTGTYYIVGNLDKSGIFISETNVKRLDKGSDYYGANFSGSDDLSNPNRKIISMGWVGNWNYTNSGIKVSQNDIQSKSRRIGSYTLARKLVLNNDLTISSTPFTDNLNEKNLKNFSGNVNLQAKINNKSYKLINLNNTAVNSKYVLDFSTKNKKYYSGLINIKFTQGKDYNEIIYNPISGQYSVSGNSSELSNSAADYYKNGPLNGQGYKNYSGISKKKNLKLTIYTDKNSIELFFPNGQVYTAARFCVNNIQNISISSQDPNNRNKYKISSREIGPKITGYVVKK